MKVIFTDFNGVLNDFNTNSNENSLSFRLPALANVEAVVNLVRFAKENNALILSISSFQNYVDMFTILCRVIFHKTEEKDLEEYLNEIKLDVRKLQSKLPKGKEETVKAFIEQYPDATFVSFEDEERFSKECNQIIVDSYTGLTDKNLLDAQKFFD